MMGNKNRIAIAQSWQELRDIYRSINLGRVKLALNLIACYQGSIKRTIVEVS